MKNQKKVFRIVMAFMGVFVGAGFASGQEIIQYFTSFGLWGIVGAVVATALFAFVGMILLDLGSHYNAGSYLDVFDNIANKVISRIIDVFLLMTLFGLGVIIQVFKILRQKNIFKIKDETFCSFFIFLCKKTGTDLVSAPVFIISIERVPPPLILLLPNRLDCLE
ncbi:hypothetical protein [Desemzia sp. FAM 23991]|uniref:hypothetical protein n=1 Tax=unclassified Desemzia TaxID=2685243 RepID=UPI00388428A2